MHFRLLVALIIAVTAGCGHSPQSDADGDGAADADAGGHGDLCEDVDCNGYACEVCDEDTGECVSRCHEDICEVCDEDTGDCVSECNEEAEICVDGRCEFWRCDPITGGGCGEGVCKVYWEDGFRAAWDCLREPSDPAAPGEPCRRDVESYDNCQAGATCVFRNDDRETSSYCMRLCTDTDASSCTGVYSNGAGGFTDGICADVFRGLVGTGIGGCLAATGCDPHCDQPCDLSSEYLPTTCLPVGDSNGHFGTVCLGRLRDPNNMLRLPGTRCPPGYVSTDDGLCNAMCDLSYTVFGPRCEFTDCGSHEGETGDEVCTAMPGTEESWQTIDVGICTLPE